MRSAASHPLVISGLVRCRSCNELVQHHGIGNVLALLMSVIHHRRICRAMNEETRAA